jgi:hypothetical protein
MLLCVQGVFKGTYSKEERGRLIGDSRNVATRANWVA